MQRIYEQMFSHTLPAIAAGEPGVRDRLAAFAEDDEGLWREQGAWRFTLPSLFAFCVAEHNRQHADESLQPSEENYDRLNKLLYRQPPNQALAPAGLRVEIALADLDPKRRVYKLMTIGHTT